MAEVVVHRCTLRVVRRHGWSWGPAPDRLLKAVVAALPWLLARKLGDLFAGEAEREITERVNLTVPVKLSELLELALESASLQDGAVGPLRSEALETRLSEAIRLAFPDETTHLESSGDNSAPDLVTDSEPESVEVRLTPRERVLTVLRQWQQSGELEIHLGSFSQEELDAWFASLCAAIAELAGAKRAVVAPRISETLQQLTRANVSTPTSPVSVSLTHFYGLLEIAEQLQHDLIDEVSLQETLERVMSSPGLIVDPQPSRVEVETELHPAPTKPDSIQLERSHPVPEPAPSIKSTPLAQTEFNIRSALPFLLLGPLSRIGYLDTLAATLETANLTTESPLFAAALAAKVLRPPERGWRRDPEDLSVVAALAGLETPPPGDAIAEFARKIEGRLTPLDSLVSYSLVKGHTPGSAVLLHETRDANNVTGLLLVELEGLFPVAWANDLESLLSALRYFSDTHLLVQQASARVGTLRSLHAAGLRFVTDAPPTRGESWREVRLAGHERLYTNDRETKPATLAGAAESLAEMAEQADLLWSALSVQRPAIPTARHSDLELSLTMAAALALGTISWTLWRDRETTTPLLALERFGNLPARVRFTSNSVQLNLPLGRRQQDLREHGFLADLRDVPWLEGRKIEFLGG